MSTPDRRAAALHVFRATEGTEEQRLHAALDAYDGDQPPPPEPETITTERAEAAARWLADTSKHNLFQDNDCWRGLLETAAYVEVARATILRRAGLPNTTIEQVFEEARVLLAWIGQNTQEGS
jgi:hypothetical protein